MTLRLSAITLAAALCAADPALAEEVVATARSEAGPPATADTAAQIDAWIRKAPPVSLPDDGPDGVVTSKAPRTPHGEVGVAVGSGGYRSAYAVTVVPVGQAGAVSLAVSTSQGGRVYGGPRRAAFDGGDRNTVALAVNLGPQAERGCAPPPVGPVAFEEHAGPDLYLAECRARARVQGAPDESILR